MRRPGGAGWPLILTLVLVGVIGIAVAGIPLYVQSRLAAALRAGLDARRVDVTVRAGPRDALAGRFDRLLLTVEDFRAGRLPVRRLHADLSGVELDGGRLQRGGELVMRRLGSGTVDVTVTEAGLADFLRSVGTLRDVRVDLADGRATVRGTIRVLTVDVAATMRGNFVLLDGRAVVFRVREMSIGSLPLPPEVGRSLSAAMNPLVTADDFPVPLRFTGVTAEHGELVLRAEAAR